MRFISVRIIVPFRPAGAEPSAEYTENSRNRQLFREIPDLFFPRKTPILERPEKPGRPYGTERSPRIRRNGRKRLTHISHETMKRFVWMLLLLPIGLQAQVRTERLLEKGWRFTRDDAPAFAEPSYDASRWQEVTVPHDWAIYGPFSAGNDLQHTAIAQDGQTQAVEHAGRTGGLPFVGTGWYRLRFEVPERNEGRRCTLLFDGAMSHARVYVNGREAIRWPNGYNSFHTDITPLLNPGGENLLAVRLENLPESSRWYPGAGIYRNVHLIVTDEAHVPVWGTQIITRRADEASARVRQCTALAVPQGKSPADYAIETAVTDPAGRIVARHRQSAGADFGDHCFEQEFTIDRPALWSPDTPALYTSTSEIYEGGELKDRYVTVFGIRTVEAVQGEGFRLNGKPLKFRGVCLHHDLGPLGGIVNESAIRHRIRLLKEMGCNAIRTSHNMPAPELIEICDETGMMVMAESFDEWETKKVENGYHKEFGQWAERDLVNLVRRFRNNPSVVMWCIGNEVPDQWNGDRGPKLSLRLQNICHREDPTRPVTQGMDAPDAVTANNMAAVMDIPGFNYRPHLYARNYLRLPQEMILGSETASTISSRGIYKFPVVRRSMPRYDDHQASSYDVEHCGWSNLPEDDFIQHDDRPYCMGEFVWTGFDYLGEPTPYYSDWPSHSSLFGIIDLAGIPKDRYWLYRSKWNPEAETLHILPHWNWKGREGEVTPVFIYTNYPEAELFINGRSQGRRRKDTGVTIDNSADSVSAADLKRQRRYRLMWMDTRYEPGTVKAVAYDEEGNAVAEREIRTAGEPYRIVLEADRTVIAADGKDYAFVTVRVEDRQGTPCPLADNEIRFEVTGAGYYRAGANGNPASLEPFQRPRMKLFSGMMTAVIAPTERPGTITVKATSPGLKKATVEIRSEAATQR